MVTAACLLASRIDFLMSLYRLSNALLLSVLAVAGCKSAPPAADPIVKAEVVPAPQPAPIAKMTDEQLVQANQKDGLGLGLRITGDHFAVGSPVPMSILIEDFGARTPIASGMCNGFSLTYEEVTTQDSRTADINNPRCFATIPSPDEIPLVKGKLKTAEITQSNASHMQIPEGTYLMTVTWNALPAGRGTILERPAYTTLKSNSVQITVK